MKNMKIAILGAGNMGGAIARGLARGRYVNASDIIASNPSCAKLEKLKEEYPEMNVTGSNSKAVSGADIVIVAVKPWKMEEVIKPLCLRRPQVLVSVAAGVTFEDLTRWVDSKMTVFRMIPNTAIAISESLTLMAAYNASDKQTEMMLNLFNEMGVTVLTEERLFPAGTSLASCGIAYVLKYVQAAMQAGIELGFKPQEAKKMVAQTMLGAARLLLEDEQSHPAVEIEKVTTPGGMTIKGLNRLEHDGFISAVINAIKESCI